MNQFVHARMLRFASRPEFTTRNAPNSQPEYTKNYKSNEKKPITGLATSGPAQLGTVDRDGKPTGQRPH